MKITIDTVNKTIEVHESGTLAEIIEFLELSKIDLKEYKFVQTLETVFVPYHTKTEKVIPGLPYQPVTPYYPDWTWRPGTIVYSTEHNHMQF